MQSPAAQGMARSLSEIVQQLFADDQLSRDCAQALSVQIGGGPNATLQQMQGMLHINQSHTFCCAGTVLCSFRRYTSCEMLIMHVDTWQMHEQGL